MHLQDRNIHGKIFGGFLMREMLEVGWVAGVSARGELRGIRLALLPRREEAGVERLGE